MPKKCIICGKEAEYLVKGTSNAYCGHCAADCFSDTSLLQKVEEAALELKKIINGKIGQ
jgi:hypothetical protein